ncbi:hypothetical protein Trydic_g1105 [Trypoxylus dichotomus]
MFTQKTYRLLRDKGYRNGALRKKSLISDKNRRFRLEFANKYKDKGEDFWKGVLFIDESKFNVFGSDGCAKILAQVRHSTTKNVIPTVQHGDGSVMVWGAIEAAGVRHLASTDGIMDRRLYKSILEEHLQPSVDSLGLGRDWIFQQDDHAKYNAHLVRDWLLYYVSRQLCSHPKSPDLNPIEHVCELTRKIDHATSKNKEFRKEALPGAG